MTVAEDPAATTAPEVPVIDLEWGESEALEAVKTACISSGFFIVSNHGLEELLEEHFKESRKFFELPLEQKNEIMVDDNSRGYTPMGEETLDVEVQTEGDTKEGLYIGREVAADSEEAKQPLHGPNQWPNPERLPDFRSAMEAYYAGLLALGERVMRLIALTLELPEDWFVQRFTRPIAILRPLHYSARISKPEEGVFGCGAHSDYGVLTLLATDGTPGLQIRQNERWMDVPSLPGTIVVNLGDMLERWTNGKYKSTMHRVISCTGTERYSTAFFMEPNFDCVIDPAQLPACCPPEKPPAWEPITSGRYLLDKYNMTHAIFGNNPNAEAVH